MNRLLCVDLDNVIARTDDVMRVVIREYTRGRVDLAYEDVRQFDYWQCQDSRGAQITVDEWHEVHSLFSTPRFLWQVQPYNGVGERLGRLSHRFRVHLATSRLPAARRTTVEWLEFHGLAQYDLHFVGGRNKHLVFRQLACAIEDDRAQADAYAAAGFECLLLAHPWNADAQRNSSLQRLRDWDELMQCLLNLSEKK